MDYKPSDLFIRFNSYVSSDDFKNETLAKAVDLSAIEDLSTLTEEDINNRIKTVIGEIFETNIQEKAYNDVTNFIVGMPSNWYLLGDLNMAYLRLKTKYKEKLDLKIDTTSFGDKLSFRKLMFDLQNKEINNYSFLDDTSLTSINVIEKMIKVSYDKNTDVLLNDAKKINEVKNLDDIVSTIIEVYKTRIGE
ncbi:hypothetical protein [Paraclostridium bifermentans]|uniref:hypothetical protein n=1 Tax=Paraclostridium bifermentans TaxID=1490 RepID=UPI00374E7243